MLSCPPDPLRRFFEYPLDPTPRRLSLHAATYTTFLVVIAFDNFTLLPSDQSVKYLDSEFPFRSFSDLVSSGLSLSLPPYSGSPGSSTAYFFLPFLFLFFEHRIQSRFPSTHLVYIASSSFNALISPFFLSIPFPFAYYLFFGLAFLIFFRSIYPSIHPSTFPFLVHSPIHPIRLSIHLSISIVHPSTSIHIHPSTHHPKLILSPFLYLLLLFCLNSCFSCVPVVPSL